MIGSNFSSQFFNQSEVKPKPSVARACTFSRALSRLPCNYLVLIDLLDCNETTDVVKLFMNLTFRLELVFVFKFNCTLGNRYFCRCMLEYTKRQVHKKFYNMRCLVMFITAVCLLI